MRIKILLLLIFSLFTMSSCLLVDIAELIFKPKNQNKEKITREEAQHRVDLYWAIITDDVDKVKKYMEEGYDPNKSLGESWSDNTPLNLLTKSCYDYYFELKRGEEIPDPPTDIAIFQILVEAGADVNKRPYIWDRVHRWNNYFYEYDLENKLLRHNLEVPKTKEEEEELKKENEEAALHYVIDTNRLIEAFLKAGADPDKRGHPYPYSLEAKRRWISDEEANEYFAKGTRPINEAIKKGMRWESQVDLLLQYTTLDKDSLKAAKQSKDKAMIEKITRLWNEQNGR